MRRFLVSCLVFVALLVVADRVGLLVAQHEVAKRLQASAQLQATPKVEIHGFPFLTQLLGGDYHSVDIRMTGLDSDGLRIDKLTVHMHNAHVSVGDVLSQDRSRIHVDQATAHLFLRFADLHPSAAMSVSVLQSADVIGVSVSGPETLTAKTKFGDLPIKLTGLPFGIRLISAKTTQTGVDITGRADGLTLRT